MCRVPQVYVRKYRLFDGVDSKKNASDGTMVRCDRWSAKEKHADSGLEKWHFLDHDQAIKLYQGWCFLLHAATTAAQGKQTSKWTRFGKSRD